MRLNESKRGVKKNGEDLMSAVMSLLAQTQKSESVEPFNLLAALVLAGLVARTIVTMIRVIITLIALAFGVMVIVAFLAEIVLRH